MAEYTLIGVPLVTGYLTSCLCPTLSTSGSSVAFRPPRVVFGIVWPILYTLIGIAWCFAHKSSQGTHRILVHVFMSLLILSMVAWMITYSCAKNKRGAVYVLLMSTALSLAVYTVCPSLMTKLMVIPLMCWLGFALMMNATEVQEKIQREKALGENDISKE